MRTTPLLAALGLTVALAAAQAQTPTAPAPQFRVGIVNIQFAILNSQEGKAQTAQLRARFAPKQQQLQAESAAIKALQQKLQAGGDTLSPEAKAELSSSINTKQKNLRNDLADANNDFRNAYNDMVNRIGQKMVGVLAAYAKLHHFSMVLDRSLRWPQNPILFSQATIDITPQVVRFYNRRYPVATPASHPVRRHPVRHAAQPRPAHRP